MQLLYLRKTFELYFVEILLVVILLFNNPALVNAECISPGRGEVMSNMCVSLIQYHCKPYAAEDKQHFELPFSSEIYEPSVSIAFLALECMHNSPEC